jgi:hypothetical protein
MPHESLVAQRREQLCDHVVDVSERLHAVAPGLVGLRDALQLFSGHFPRF